MDKLREWMEITYSLPLNRFKLVSEVLAVLVSYYPSSKSSTIKLSSWGFRSGFSLLS